MMNGNSSRLFLLVYHDNANPAHWRLLLANPGSESVGTTIEVVSSFFGGFEHKITHGYDESSSRSARSKIALGSIDANLAANVEDCARRTDANGVDCDLAVEEVILFYKAQFLWRSLERMSDMNNLSASGIQLPDLDESGCE